MATKTITPANLICKSLLFFFVFAIASQAVVWLGGFVAVLVALKFVLEAK